MPEYFSNMLWENTISVKKNKDAIGNTKQHRIPNSWPASNVASGRFCIHKEPVENRRHLARSFRA